MMIILSGLPFIFRFLPVFLIAYYLAPAKYRNALLFIGSLFFYAMGEGVLVGVLAALTVLNWYLGDLIFQSREKGDADQELKKRKLLLICAVSVNVLVLGGFKAVAGLEMYHLPVGLSFYIFKMISYMADVYKKEITIRPAFTETAAYFTMFSQLTEGPITRFNDGFKDHFIVSRFDPESFEDGLIYFIMGLSMKALLADRIVTLWNELSKIGYESISLPLAWSGVFGYSAYLYFDFWGYSLMAAGVTMMLGFPFAENFHHPYAAIGVADFYRRWHASLGRWFRDYVYIPLGGSRKGQKATARNLFIVWILTGIWHGVTANFLIWSMSLLAMIYLEKYALIRIKDRYPALYKGIGRAEVILLVPLTWAVFAISDLGQLGLFFSRLFTGAALAEGCSDFAELFPVYLPYLTAAVILCFPQVFEFMISHRKNVFMTAALFVLFWISIYFVGIGGSNSFAYLSF